MLRSRQHAAADPRCTPFVRAAAALVVLGVVASWPATPAAAATLTIRFTNQGLPLQDPQHGKFYVYEAGQRERYVDWGYDGRSARFPDGTYDVVIKYENDHVQRQRVWQEIELAGSVERQVDFNAPEARLTLWITSGGSPIAKYSGSYSVHRAGQRGKPLATKRPGSTLVIAPGVYDIEATYRAPEGLKSVWLEDYSLRSQHQETVEMGGGEARARFTLLRNGRPLNADEGRWGLFRPGSRETPVTEARSGESRSVGPGTYDIGLFYRQETGRGERWLIGVELQGDVDRRVEISPAAETVRVDIRHRGARLRDAWFTVHPVQERQTPLQTAASGGTVEIAPGTYDIGCFLTRGGIRVEKWLEGQTIEESTELNVELEFDAASLRVRPPRRRGKADDRDGTSVLLVLDSSVAMGAGPRTETWLELAVDALTPALDVFSGTRVDVGLRAFGIVPRVQQDCRDSALLVPPRGFDRRRLTRALEVLHPDGYAPVALSLEQSGPDVAGLGRSSLLLITASGDNCGGDPCSAGAGLLRTGEVDRIDVVALGMSRGERERLACLGNVYPINTDLQLRSTLMQILRGIRRGEDGSVVVLRPGRDELVVAGPLRKQLDVAAGRYDVIVRWGGETYEWPGIEIRGAMEATAGRRPPRPR